MKTAEFSWPSTTPVCNASTSPLIGIGVAAAPIDFMNSMKTGLSITRILSPEASVGVFTRRLLVPKLRKPFSVNASTRSPVVLAISSPI
jgi:hypothetical protein